MKAVLYLRQSLDKTGEALGIERQREQCDRLCEARRYEVAEVIVDNSVSATKGDRPGYQRLLELIEHKQVDVVVVLRIDRLLRRLTELEDLIELSERTGVRIATVEGDFDLTTSQGRLIGRILASVAKGEMETKSARHKLANAQKAAAGKPHGSRRPYAYENDLVTLCEPEAAVLREMGRRIMVGHGYKEVAWWANEHGHTTTTGKLWYALTVRNMLRKKRYGGIREHSGTDYPATWAPDFDAETWERLQLTIKDKQRPSETPRARKYLLTGLVYCGNCGTPLHGGIKRDRANAPLRRTYRCRSAGDAHRHEGCGKVRRNADALDHFVAECVLFRLDTPELGALLSGGDDGQLRELHSKRHAQKLRLDALTDDYATGELDKTQFSRANATAKAALARIDAEIDTCRRQQVMTNLPVGETVRQAWERSESDDWKRALLALLIKRIDVRPGITKPLYKVGDITYRFDPQLVEITWLA